MLLELEQNLKLEATARREQPHGESNRTARATAGQSNRTARGTARQADPAIGGVAGISAGAVSRVKNLRIGKGYIVPASHRPKVKEREGSKITRIASFDSGPGAHQLERHGKSWKISSHQKFVI